MARGDLTTEAAGTADAAGRLAFLDGWRAIAVVLVLQSHLIGFRSEPAFLKLIGRWMPAGQIGVLIFFFISGLVITRAALAEIDVTAGFSLRAFYIRRAFRIMPPLAFYLAVCVLLGAFGIVDFGIGNALPALLYVCNIGPLNSCLWLGGHTWSLAFEEQFYLLFPILLSVFVLHRRPVIVHAVIVVLICLAPLVFPVSYIGWFSFTLSYALFVAGCLAARYGREVAAVLGRYPAAWFIAAAALILVTPFTLSTPILNDYYPLSFIVTIPIMVMSSGWAGGVVQRVLANRGLVYVGRISYSVYLWQELATSDLFRKQNLVLELLALGGVFLISAVLFEVMEKPLIALGRRLSRRGLQRPADAVQAPA